MRAKAMIASLMLLVSLCHFVPTHAKDGSPITSAASTALLETSTGKFLYTKDAHTRRPMASTTKIMTALVAIEAGDLDTPVTVGKESVGVEGSSLYLKCGEKIPLRELLYGLMLQSANDAATAIAVHVAGSVPAFSEMMNRRAQELGLENTHFTNPHGLHEDSHYTTAYDLALIAAEAMENDTFREIVSTKRHTLPATELADARVLVNHNKLLSLNGNAVGIKTGFTKKSGRCLVGAAEKDGVRLVSVTLNAPNDWNDHSTLFSYGFSVTECRTLAEAGALRFSLPVVGGSTDRLLCVNSEAVTAVLPRCSPEPTVSVHLPHFAAAPVKAGEVLGKVDFLLDGKVIASASLVAATDIPELFDHKGLF